MSHELQINAQHSCVDIEWDILYVRHNAYVDDAADS